MRLLDQQFTQTSFYGVRRMRSTDITYIRLSQGFIYLVAIIDWFSRYVLAWQVSNTHIFVEPV
jgi:transposase InsO family protein